MAHYKKNYSIIRLWLLQITRYWCLFFFFWWQVIDPSRSSVELLGTKAEIKLRKADACGWNTLFSIQQPTNSEKSSDSTQPPGDNSEWSLLPVQLPPKPTQVIYVTGNWLWSTGVGNYFLYPYYISYWRAEYSRGNRTCCALSCCGCQIPCSLTLANFFWKIVNGEINEKLLLSSRMSDL